MAHDQVPTKASKYGFYTALVHESYIVGIGACFRPLGQILTLLTDPADVIADPADVIAACITARIQDPLSMTAVLGP